MAQLVVAAQKFPKLPERGFSYRFVSLWTSSYYVPESKMVAEGGHLDRSRSGLDLGSLPDLRSDPWGPPFHEMAVTCLGSQS